VRKAHSLLILRETSSKQGTSSHNCVWQLETFKLGGSLCTLALLLSKASSFVEVEKASRCLKIEEIVELSLTVGGSNMKSPLYTVKFYPIY
jgi:hypothetical protein